MVGDGDEGVDKNGRYGAGMCDDVKGRVLDDSITKLNTLLSLLNKF